MSHLDPSGASFARSSLRDTVTQAAGRIDSIIDSAEEIANQIHAEAVAEASAYRDSQKAKVDALVAEQRAQFGALSKGFCERAQALHREAEVLATEIASALHSLESREEEVAVSPELAEPKEDQVPPVGRDTGEAPLTGTGPLAGETISPEAIEAEKAAETEGSVEATREEALLRVTQMAVERRARDEIEATIKEEFGIAEPRALADEILGPSGT